MVKGREAASFLMNEGMSGCSRPEAPRMLTWLLITGIAIVVLGYLLGLVGYRRQTAAAGTTLEPNTVTEPAMDASTQQDDKRATELQEAGAILLRVGLIVALVGLVGWDILKFLLSLAGGVLTPG